MPAKPEDSGNEAKRLVASTTYTKQLSKRRKLNTNSTLPQLKTPAAVRIPSELQIQILTHLVYLERDDSDPGDWLDNPDLMRYEFKLSDAARKTLQHISLSCRAWRLSAQSLLFHRMTLRIYADGRSSNLESLLKYRPGFASSVRILYIVLVGPPSGCRACSRKYSKQRMQIEQFLDNHSEFKEGDAFGRLWEDSVSRRRFSLSSSRKRDGDFETTTITIRTALRRVIHLLTDLHYVAVSTSGIENPPVPPLLARWITELGMPTEVYGCTHNRDDGRVAHRLIKNAADIVVALIPSTVTGMHGVGLPPIPRRLLDEDVQDDDHSLADADLRRNFLRRSMLYMRYIHVQRRFGPFQWSSYLADFPELPALVCQKYGITPGASAFPNSWAAVLPHLKSLRIVRLDLRPFKCWPIGGALEYFLDHWDATNVEQFYIEANSITMDCLFKLFSLSRLKYLNLRGFSCPRGTKWRDIFQELRAMLREHQIQLQFRLKLDLTYRSKKFGPHESVESETARRLNRQYEQFMMEKDE